MAKTKKCTSCGSTMELIACCYQCSNDKCGNSEKAR